MNSSTAQHRPHNILRILVLAVLECWLRVVDCLVCCLTLVILGICMRTAALLCYSHTMSFPQYVPGHRLPYVIIRFLSLFVTCHCSSREWSSF